MRKISVVIILFTLFTVSFVRVDSSSISAAQAQENRANPCALLTQQNPRSPECDAEIAANPLPEMERPVEYDPTRDIEAHPRSVLLPEEAPAYPIGWQKRAWYFSDAPGVLPADNDWTNERLVGKYSMYLIYAAVPIFNDIWYLIGPGQWMKDEFVSVLQIPEIPEEVEGPWVAVDLTQQTLVAFMDDQPEFATLVSAGYWLATEEGLFQLYGRTLSMHMSGPPGANPPKYNFPTRWAMFFNEHEALHGADFHNYFGIARTHGCVNLVPGDAEWVWNFFERTEDEWHPSGDNEFLVENLEAAPYILVYSSPKIPEIPQW
jgi:hypothetical protein